LNGRISSVAEFRHNCLKEETNDKEGERNKDGRNERNICKKFKRVISLASETYMRQVLAFSNSQCRYDFHMA
jgi:hypothetical protein